jgi:hypothetical protein
VGGARGPPPPDDGGVRGQAAYARTAASPGSAAKPALLA